MSKHLDESETDEREDRGTGSFGPSGGYITRIYPFNQYLITLKLAPDGTFIGIEEVRVNKDFRSYKQKVSQKIIRYVDEYEPK